MKKIKVYVHLLDEGTPTLRPVMATKIDDNHYVLHATDDYDPDDEIWEFLPESIVFCQIEKLASGNNCLVAKSLAKKDL